MDELETSTRTEEKYGFSGSWGRKLESRKAKIKKFNCMYFELYQGVMYLELYEGVW